MDLLALAAMESGAEGRQASIVPLLRTSLPTLHSHSRDEQDILLTLWLECVHEGMDSNDLLSLVAAQSLLQDRALIMDHLPCSLLQAEIIQHCSIPFWRIYLHVLLKATWALRRRVHKEASTIVYPDSRHFAKVEDTLSKVVQFLWNEAPKCTGDSQRLVITFVHQLYLEFPNLIGKTFLLASSYDLIPWIVEYAPSTRIIRCSDCFLPYRHALGQINLGDSAHGNI